ncbi:MAG TPA: hypothetical protein VF223_24290 [Trebonia sp.]
MALGDAGGVVRERWALLGKLRDAGWRLSLALCLTALVTALIPAASAVTPLAFAIQSRVDGRHRAAVARLAASAPVLAELESQRVQDLIQVARADPWNWTERTPGSAVLSQVDIAFSYVGLVSSCAVLAYFSPWLVPAIVIPAWAAREVFLRRLRADMRLWLARQTDGRRSCYWLEVATSAATGKELRIFGFGPWAFDRSLRHRLAMFEPVRRGRLRQCVTGPVTVLGLCGVPLAVSYALVAAGTAGGHHSVAAETAVLSAGVSVFLSLSTAMPLVAAVRQPGPGRRREGRDRLGGGLPAAAAPVRDGYLRQGWQGDPAVSGGG